MALPHFGGNWTYNSSTPKNDRLSRMLNGHDDSGYVRFKYYGEFKVMERIHSDCKEDLSYVGNSNIDGSPVFVYYYSDINIDTIRDFKELNIVLRNIKLKHYSKKELTKKEQSIFSFFRFFMIAYDNLEIKGLPQCEINEVSFNTD